MGWSRFIHLLNGNAVPRLNLPIAGHSIRSPCHADRDSCPPHPPHPGLPPPDRAPPRRRVRAFRPRRDPGARTVRRPQRPPGWRRQALPALRGPATRRSRGGRGRGRAGGPRPLGRGERGDALSRASAVLTRQIGRSGSGRRADACPPSGRPPSTRRPDAGANGAEWQSPPRPPPGAPMSATITAFSPRSAHARRPRTLARRREPGVPLEAKHVRARSCPTAGCSCTAWSP